MTLKNWAIVGEQDPYKAPELQEKRLQGFIYGDSRFEDGSPIQTSRIVSYKWDEDEDKVMAETRSGSHYDLFLSDIDPLYLAAVPSIKSTLFPSKI